jgi:hypothetical protein
LAKSPTYDLSNVWIQIHLATYSEGVAEPENVFCQLAFNYGQTPAPLSYERAQYIDGDLYLYFEKLEPFTLLQFVIGWFHGGEEWEHADKYPQNDFKEQGLPHTRALKTINVSTGFYGENSSMSALGGIKG